MVPLSLVVCSLIALALAADVQQCPGQSFPSLADNVKMKCGGHTCRLKKGTDMDITLTFTAEKDLVDVTNHVTADVFGVELPFVGVDGNSICGKLQTETGEKASCPLKAGNKYIYKESFPILSFYPTIDVKVHWSLMDGKRSILCFQVPARIVK